MNNIVKVRVSQTVRKILSSHVIANDSSIQDFAERAIIELLKREGEETIKFCKIDQDLMDFSLQKR